MLTKRTAVFVAALGLLTAVAPLTLPGNPVVAQASEIKYIVNNVPVTSYDIQRRAAFIKLQRGKGSASEQMIEQALRNAEAARLGIKVGDQQVDDAYARFAKDNKLAVKQLDQILQQAGVTKSHFKDYIRSQMSWSQALGQRSRAGKSGIGGNEQDAVRQMLQKGGAKPKATEYMLQQVIFVVPAGQKGIMGARKREAEAMRNRFRSCDTTRSFAKGLVDVTVRDLGRVLEPQLPGDWSELIKNTESGSATSVRETERGVEFIGICSAREVSDDRVAQLAFQAEKGKGEGGTADALSKSYTQELREKAKIVER
jgi:peptidyl-prolyl cis-trans isomerase SurA